MTLSLIVPVYRNEANLPHLLKALVALASEHLLRQLELVFVVDGSPDRSYETLRDALPAFPVPSRLLLLTRNFGSFAAIRAGLEAGVGPFYAVMAADLQEPPSLIVKMHQALLNDEADVVVGVRASRADPWFVRLPSRIFWGIYRRFVIQEMPPGGVDVFGCNQAFRDQLLQLSESHSSLIAQIFWLGFRRKTLSYERLARREGRSAWTLEKKVAYLMDSIFSFTDLPIRLLVRVGGIGAILSGLFGMVVVILRMLNWIDVPGYAATMLGIIFFGTVNLMALGIIGSYAWRAYENTKQRPLNIVLRAHTFRNETPSC
ncbi:MAG: glycosyltransferase family 2 protein [Gammaproteobacteria bacterium]|nr:glycosyltransferase family 2 protein [Gammaproteobacteria bacterium]MDH3410935.1 glycosyltransferase family 2 protein [Gammaproteobacteria bacterium]